MSAPVLLSARQVCQHLGISQAHLFVLKRTGRMPVKPIRLGRAVRFDADELRDWIGAGAPPADKWATLKSQVQS